MENYDEIFLFSRLEFSPPTLFSLALDASCEVMEHRKFTSQLPRIIMEAINKRMPKFCYDRARRAVFNAAAAAQR